MLTDPMLYVILLGMAARTVIALRDSKNNAKLQDSRHVETVDKLDEIVKKVNLINGTVGRHDAILSILGKEIDRLRDSSSA